MSSCDPLPAVWSHQPLCEHRASPRDDEERRSAAASVSGERKAFSVEKREGEDERREKEGSGRRGEEQSRITRRREKLLWGESFRNEGSGLRVENEDQEKYTCNEKELQRNAKIPTKTKESKLEKLGMAREEEAAESGKDEEERRGREEREGRGPPVKCRGCIHLVATKRMSVSDTAERMRGAMREMLPSNSSDQEGRPGPVSVWDIARLIRRKTG